MSSDDQKVATQASGENVSFLLSKMDEIAEQLPTEEYRIKFAFLIETLIDYITCLQERLRTK